MIPLLTKDASVEEEVGVKKIISAVLVSVQGTVYRLGMPVIVEKDGDTLFCFNLTSVNNANQRALIRVSDIDWKATLR